MKKYRKFIKKGVIESLDKVPFHSKAPIKRLSMLSKSLIPQSNTHIAVHFVDASKNLPKYSKLHKHNHDEVNLILSEDSNLTYEIQLEEESYKEGHLQLFSFQRELNTVHRRFRVKEFLYV